MKQVTRSEWLAIAGIVLVGAGLRLVALDRLAVEHFDEGVYASNVWFGPREDFQYPNQHLYAPPLVPFLIETIFQIFGPSNLGAMAVSLTAGCLTVPLVWWVGRRWFDPLAGLIAASLCATSSLHILLSRTCLVDALLGFWLLLAVWLITEAFERKSILWAIAGGIATGLAWWTKYNGWLPLAITGAGLAWWCLRSRSTPRDGEAPAEPLGVGQVSNLPGDPDRLKTCPTARQEPRPPVWRLALLWLIAAGVAVAIWSPVVIGLQDKGGYAAVMANHRQYVVGLAGWLGSMREFILRVDDPRGAAWLLVFVRWGLVAWSVWVVARGRFTWNGARGWEAWGEVFLALTHPLLSLLYVVPAIFRELASSGRLNRLVLTAWVVGLLLVTPLYTPYPRLWLPWLISVYVLVGAGISGIVNETRTRSPAETVMQYLVGLVGIFVLVYGFVIDVPSGKLSRDIRLAAADLADTVLQGTSRSEQSVVYVYGEPALLFQLRLFGLPVVQPVEHLNFARPGELKATVPTYVITGPHADRTANFMEQFHTAAPRLRLVETIHWQRSRVGLMDEPSSTTRTTSEFRLYRVE